MMYDSEIIKSGLFKAFGEPDFQNNIIHPGLEGLISPSMSRFKDDFKIYIGQIRDLVSIRIATPGKCEYEVDIRESGEDIILKHILHFFVNL